MPIRFFYVTTDNQKSAKKIAKILLKEKLIACANILPKMTSIYRWKGKLEESHECVLILKSNKKNSKKIIARVKQLHTYEVPCVLSLSIEDGNQDYIHWLESSLK